MNEFENHSRFLTWSIALLLSALAAGCGGGGGSSQDPILGAGGATLGSAIPGAPAGAILPGAVCTVTAGPTIPTVTSSNPANGALNVTTSTTGVAGGGKLITATFSLAMNPATIISPALTFTLVNNTTAGSNVAGAVTMNAANTVATFTTAAALPANNSYTAVITQAAATPGGVAISCIYAWNFTTGAVATGLAPINMGLAAPFGISATAGLATAISSSTVNADVLLDPIAFAICNVTPVDGAGGIGSCAAIGFPPSIVGTVISPLFTGGRNIATIRADLDAAYLSLCAPGLPAAACTLGGATNLPAGTTLGALTGSALVQGDNYFVPGVYQSTTSILITDDLTLDALGDPNAVFIFQSSSTIGTAAGAAPPGVRTRILLVNGARASNVWWSAGSSATLGLFSEFQGTLLANASVTLNNGATTCGRMHAGARIGGGGAITLGGANVVSVPGQPFAPPAGYSTTCQ